MLSYKNIKSDRQWRGTIGLSESKFFLLASKLKEHYEEKHGIPLWEKASNLGKEFLLETYEDCLFFVLFQLKNSLNLDSLGLLINTDASNAKKNFDKYLQLVSQILTSMGVMPKRKFESVAEFEAYFSGVESLLVDASEQAINRPKGNEKQKEMYSAKKKAFV